MGTVGYPGLSRCLRAGFAAFQAFPELAELAGQFNILQIAETLARHHDNVPANQVVLVEAERFADLAFQAIALNRELDALLADHQTQTGVVKLVVARQQQDIFARNFAARGVEDCLELSGG